MENNYTLDKKKKLLDKIKKLTSRSDFDQIKKIITEHNPNLDSMKNANGMFLSFGSLSNQTYIELSSYLDKMEKKRIKQMKNEILESSDIFSTEDTTMLTQSIEQPDKNMSKKLRLTNGESHILNRVKYEKELKKNGNISEDFEELTVYDPNVFQSKQSKVVKNKNQKIDDIFVHVDEEEDKVKKIKPSTKPAVKKVKN